MKIKYFIFHYLKRNTKKKYQGYAKNNWSRLPRPNALLSFIFSGQPLKSGKWVRVRGRVSFTVRDKVRDSLRGEVRVRARASVRGRGVLEHNIYSPNENLLRRNFWEIQVRLHLQNYRILKLKFAKKLRMSQPQNKSK